MAANRVLKQYVDIICFIAIRMSTLHLFIPNSFQLQNFSQIYINSVLLAATKYQRHSQAGHSEDQEQLPTRSNIKMCVKIYIRVK
jgi:hypothetical protein